MMRAVLPSIAVAVVVVACLLIILPIVLWQGRWIILPVFWHDVVVVGAHL